MKKKLHLKIFCPFAVVIMTLLPSCKKFVEIAPPETQAEESKIFADDLTATSAAVGVYYQMTALTGGFNNGGITLYCGLSADDISNVSSNATYDAFKNNALLSANNTISNIFWSNPYKIIYQANAVIEGLLSSKTMTDAVKNQLQGEMLYVRALNYFYLINLFGAVPFQTATDYQINSVMPRTSADKIYDQITTDLVQARSLLSASYGSVNNMRPNKDAVTALLARVYLYRNDWTNAAAMATEVIDSKKYALESPANTFLTASKETIFQLYKQTSNTAEAGYFIPSSATVRPTFTVTNNLLNAFETGDNRKTNWLKSNTVSGVVYYYPFKYKTKALTPITEYVIVQRFAELYLIRSEARANLNDLSGAIDDVDMIRSRAGLLTIRSTNPSITKAPLLAAILKENQIEFFAEWGHRWFDLKRSGNADAILGTNKGSNWQSTDALYPIPFAQIQLNPFLTQNTGYN
jgi:hypothetical protein